MRIGIDLDGVVADFDKAWVDRYNADFDGDLEYKHCDHWDSLLTITHFDDYDEWWEWAQSKHEDLFLEAPELPGAVEGIQKLKELGHTIVIITAKPRWAAGHPSTWMIKHDIPYDEIHVTNDKQYVICDAYIDDAHHNLKTYTECFPDKLIIQYIAWPYVNRGAEFQEYPGVVVCRNWEEVLKEIDKWQESSSDTKAGSSGSVDTPKQGRIQRLRDSLRKGTGESHSLTYLGT